MRKRVVEFDDVINRQRETIYAERDKVLRNEDLTETVRAFLEEEIEALVDEPPARRQRRRLGHGGARRPRSRRWASTAPGTTEDELWEIGSRDAILEHLLELADERLEARERPRSARPTGHVERLVLLRTIDSLWVEHLTEIDDMRRGIGLRGYAQQDPLNEFRREAFGLYEELRGLIRHQVASTIFRVTVDPAQPPPGGRRRRGEPAAGRPRRVPAAASRRPRGCRRRGAAGGLRRPRRRPRRPAAAPAGARPVGAGVGGGLASDPMARRAGASRAAAAGACRPAGAQPGFTPTGARIGRNDPCWCGSGLKYKKCHGR